MKAQPPFHFMNEIDKIEVDPLTGDATFYFRGFTEPYGLQEFEIGSVTRNVLEEIQDAIQVLRHQKPKKR